LVLSGPRTSGALCRFRLQDLRDFFFMQTPIKKARAGCPAAPVNFEIYSLFQE